MSINVNKITSTLAKLGDTELQQYAQMHKNDPYIMALAMSESNRRKELRDADQAAQGMQEQPKVVDRMVAEMAPQPAPQQLPEEMGIARIPAGEMNFAGGGIVAFADGGDVERYSGQFGSLTGEFSGFGGMSPEQAAAAELQAAEEARLKQLDELQKKTAFLKATGAPQAQAAQAQLDVLKASMQPKPSPTDPNFRRQQDPRIAGTTATAQPLITSGAAATAGAGPKVPTAKIEPSAKTDTGGLDSLISKFTRDTDLAQGKLQNLRAGQIAELNAAAAAQQAEGKKQRAERGDVFAGREARLAEREKGVEGMKDKNFGLALLQAGAAMMSTPGNLGTAIGKGVQVGSERYIAGIDKINAAKEKFAEARDRLDDLRINRDDMNAKEIREENAAIRNARLQGLQLLTDGATNDLKMTVENQREFFKVGANALLTDKKIASDERIARMQNRTPAEIQMIERIMKERNIPFTEAYNYLTTAKREPMSQEKLRADWLDPAKRMQISEDYPNIKTFEDYMTVFGGGMGGGGAGDFKLVGVRPAK